MRVIKEFKMLDKVSSAQVSDEVWNLVADIITIDVDGSFSGASLLVQGKSDKDSTWRDISMIAFDGYAIKSEITEPGAYIGPILGYSSVRINLASVSGEITVHARFVDSTGGN